MQFRLNSLVAGLLVLAAASPAAAQNDPRVGLKGGAVDPNTGAFTAKAAEAAWNIKLLSNTLPPPPFLGQTNSDLAFTGKYVIQGNYGGPILWDISDPMHPVLATKDLCPASQNDVSVFKNLMFMSNESGSGRLDCGGGGIKEAVSKDRLRGIRIFDITNIFDPKYIANVQTCRGSHTHTVVTQPGDTDNVYIYVSGQAGVRPAAELPGCSAADPSQDPNSARFRIEVIKVPLAHPEQAAIVSSARIFNDLAAPKGHGEAPADKAEMDAARAKGAFIAVVGTDEFVLPDGFVKPMLDSTVKARGGTGAPTKADSDAFRAYLPTLVKLLTGGGSANAKPTGPDQCHDITVYPAIGLAGGACAGYGLLLDIKDAAHPTRIFAVSDSNFSYWHSATFNNDGTKLLFSDEWGGGGAPKCRSSDPKEWGADAIFALEKGKLTFKSYYKMPAAQTSYENCVAHNGSLIPIPGRDVMVQAWYQGGISVFDFTDASHPKEIAFFDRGPVDTTHMAMGGSWSVYWYNGVIVSSEIARGLDLFSLQPSLFISQNEIDAANTIHFDQLNVQDQQKFVWPPSFALSRAYLDQLERNHGQSPELIASARKGLDAANKLNGKKMAAALNALATTLHADADKATDKTKAHMLAASVGSLAAAQ